MKIYLASPFFNEEQIRVVEKLESAIKYYNHELYSPMRSGIILKDLNQEERKKACLSVFEENVDEINNADLIIANTDDFDTGTIWEIGYAFGKDKKIITYSPKGYGANVMISEASNGHYIDYEDLFEDLLTGKFSGKQESVE